MLIVKHFPGGALNSSPPRQYSILVDGVADIVFALPGYTSDLFPKTNLIGFPGVCRTAIECTEAIERARPVLEREYQAKVLAMWSMGSPVLLTRDRPVRTLEDLRGFVASRWVADQGFSAAQLVLLILAAFIVLGTFLDGFAILVLTIPLVQPILVSMGAIYRGVVPF